MPENTQSKADKVEFAANDALRTASGESLEAGVGMNPVLRCTFRTVSVSSHAAQTGSQWRVWMLGKPNRSGLSGNSVALKPRAALRRISCAAISGSRSHGMADGTKRSGYNPATSSLNQSLYARTNASPASASWISENR